MFLKNQSILSKFPKKNDRIIPEYLQQTKMLIRQRANPTMYQVSFITVRAKGDFILFDG